MLRPDKQQMVPVDKQARRMGRKVLQVYQEEDPKALATVTAAKTTCREGCNHCCSNLIMTTLPEAVAVAEFLLSTVYWQARLPQLSQSIYKQFPALVAPDLTPQSYLEKKQPCVFLTEGKCSIYAVRPGSCRYHNVVSPPENCSADAPGSEVAKIDLRKHEHAVWEAGTKVSKQVGAPPALVAPLQVLVFWALKALTEGMTTLDEGFTNPELGVMSFGYWISRLTQEAPG
jgi:Fe-S-cluster containining protein